MHIVLILLATLILGAVADAVVESVRAGADTVVAFGTTLYSHGPVTTLEILAGASAAATLLWAWSIARARHRRTERGINNEVDRRWAQLSEHTAGVEARNTLLEWRVGELVGQVEDLVRTRDELLDEMNAVKTRTGELQRLAREQREALAREGISGSELYVVPEAEPSARGEDAPVAADQPSDQPDDVSAWQGRPD